MKSFFIILLFSFSCKAKIDVNGEKIINSQQGSVSQIDSSESYSIAPKLKEIPQIELILGVDVTEIEFAEKDESISSCVISP